MAKLTNMQLKPRKDLTNKVFGKLTVIEVVSKDKHSHYQWLCRCECGNTKIINGDNLVRNLTTSCGCYHAQRNTETHKLTNTYKFYDNYVIGVDSKGNEFKFDLEDYKEVSQYYWTVTRGYVKNILNNILLHRLVTKCPVDMVVDHINHDTLNNCKSNLRLCTKQQNSCNMTPRKRGITKVGNKYQVLLHYKGKRHYLGLHPTYEDALKVRINAEKKYYKDFRYGGFSNEEK